MYGSMSYPLSNDLLTAEKETKEFLCKQALEDAPAQHAMISWAELRAKVPYPAPKNPAREPFPRRSTYGWR
jgi:hypothetical protein